MANYTAVTRSNYFRVKDPEAFLGWAETMPDLRVWDKDGHYAIAGEGDSGGWPSYDHHEDREIDFEAELVEFLADDEVVILIEIGFEKLRYLVGQAVAITRRDDGIPRMLSVGLEEIYSKVKSEWGLEPTLASY